MKVSIRTPGLGPHRFTDDVGFYKVIDRNRDHLQNLVWASSATQETTTAYLDMVRHTHEKFWFIEVEWRIAGCVTLRDKGDHYEIGYWLDEQHRRKGVMLEAVKLALQGITKPVHARIRCKNLASWSVLERNHFRVVSTPNDDPEWMTMRLVPNVK